MMKHKHRREILAVWERNWY